MSQRKDNTPQDSADREIVITRLLDAPRTLVFEAWTDPKHLSQWWGPRGFRTTTHEMVVKPGGIWRFMMHGPDGTNFPNKIVYQEVAAPERLVYLHGDDDGTSAPFQVTITFSEEGGKTKVTMRSLFPTPEERANVVKFGAIEGGNQTLDRLADQLAALGAVMRPFVISREFDAPRDLVFKAWTDREHLRHWWGPKGMTIDTCTNDPRPGGVMHYHMHGPGGHEMWGKWIYREIIAPERLVFVSSFSDEHGGVTRHPLAPEWPSEILTTVTFREQDGRTIVNVNFVPLHPDATERKTFDEGHDSMRGGWTGTLDNLSAHLAQTPAGAPRTLPSVVQPT